MFERKGWTITTKYGLWFATSSSHERTIRDGDFVQDVPVTLQGFSEKDLIEEIDEFEEEHGV